MNEYEAREFMGRLGCAISIIGLLMMFTIGPACYGGYVKNTYSITDMGYWQKWLGGGLSGLGLGLYLSSLPLEDYRNAARSRPTSLPNK